MRVTLNKGLTQSVTIRGLTWPMDMETSPTAAYELLLALEAVRAELIDMTTNYHDCSECGQTHANSVQGCSALDEEELQDERSL